MDKRIKVKMFVDLCMTGSLLSAMSYLLIGEEAHEWIGTALLVLFVFHRILNYRWYRNLLRGTYTAFRILQILLNILMSAAIIGLAVSGIMLSRYVFDFLPISGFTSFGRKLHMISAYWGFVLMAAHLGLHWGMVLGIMEKLIKAKRKDRIIRWPLRLAGVSIAGYG